MHPPMTSGGTQSNLMGLLLASVVRTGAELDRD
jgi:glutamate/tyrosine decarboxylase-like PLP-dependent enzyme